MNDNMTRVTREALGEFGETKGKRFSKWTGYPCPQKRAHLLKDDQRAGAVEASGNVLSKYTLSTSNKNCRWIEICFYLFIIV